MHSIVHIVLWFSLLVSFSSSFDCAEAHNIVKLHFIHHFIFLCTKEPSICLCTHLISEWVMEHSQYEQLKLEINMNAIGSAYSYNNHMLICSSSHLYRSPFFDSIVFILLNNNWITFVFTESSVQPFIKWSIVLISKKNSRISNRKKHETYKVRRKFSR